jgi:hypothetical protein
MATILSQTRTKLTLLIPELEFKVLAFFVLFENVC